MIRRDLTHHFYYDGTNETKLAPIALSLGKQIFDYIDGVLQDSNLLNLERLDSYGHHDSIVDWATTYEIDNRTGGQSENSIQGRSLIGWYINSQNDNNLLILEVLFGILANYSPNLDNITMRDYNDIYFYIDLYYSRTRVKNGILRSPLSANYTGPNTAQDFPSDLINNAGICQSISSNKIESNKFVVDVPLQYISNDSGKFLTFNTTMNALPRIGTIQVNSSETRKAFIFASNNVRHLDNNSYNLLPQSIMTLSGDNFNYGRPNILNDKTFTELGDKIPAMPIYVGIDNANPSTSLDFQGSLGGFLQTCSNFKDQTYAEYVINNAHYKNLGNCFLMRE